MGTSNGNRGQGGRQPLIPSWLPPAEPTASSARLNRRRATHLPTAATANTPAASSSRRYPGGGGRSDSRRREAISLGSPARVAAIARASAALYLAMCPPASGGSRNSGAANGIVPHRRCATPRFSLWRCRRRSTRGPARAQSRRSRRPTDRRSIRRPDRICLSRRRHPR